jgi:hypothetical protein
MPIDFTKPELTGNYSTDIIGPINDALKALGQWLDPIVAGTVTSAPTGAFRVNSGTSQVARFDGTTWQAQKINGISFDGANVGVNIAAPLAVFHVDGASRVSRVGAAGQYIESFLDGSSNRFTSYSAVSNAKPLILDSTTDGANTPQTAGSLGIFMRVLGVTQFSLDTNSNFALGQGSAYRKLSVIGAGAHIHASNAHGGLYFDGMSAAQGSVASGAHYDSFSSPNYVYTARSTSAGGYRINAGNHLWWSNTGLTAGVNFNSTVRMQLDVSGNLLVSGNGRFNDATYGSLGVVEGASNGIAPNTNYDSIVVDSSGNSGLTFIGPATATQGVIFGDVNSNIVGRLTYAHSTDTMTAVVGGVTAWSAVDNVFSPGSTYEFVLSDVAPTSVFSAGFRGSPVIIRDASAAFGLGDSGKTIRKTNSTAYTWTINPDATTNFPIGTIIPLQHDGTAGNVTIARGSGVVLMSGLTDGNATLTAGQSASIQKMAANRWRYLG